MTVLQAKVLNLLKANRGAFISGESIANAASVSRTAVMKAVNALKNQGYEISSQRRCGYMLENGPDALNETLIHEKLHDLDCDTDVQVYETIGSTNNEGKKQAHNLEKPLIIVSEQQTMGRGRQGHSFYSPAGSGLYLTIVTPSELPFSTMALCTQLMAVAAVRAVKAAGGPELRIKWVNDLYLGTKKTAGILTEAVSNLETQKAEAVVCGIGLNLTTSVFPDEINGIAGSLGKLDRNILTAEIASRFLKMAGELPDTSSWLGEYRERSFVIGHPLSFTLNGELLHGIGKEIDDQGRLIVSLEDGSDIVLSSGEVSIIPELHNGQ